MRKTKGDERLSGNGKDRKTERECIMRLWNILANARKGLLCKVPNFVQSH